MFHISGNSAMSAPISRAWRQNATPLARFASWSVPCAVICNSATRRVLMGDQSFLARRLVRCASRDTSARKTQMAAPARERGLERMRPAEDDETSEKRLVEVVVDVIHGLAD